MKEALRTAMMVSKAGNLFFQVGAACPAPVVALAVGCSRLAQRPREHKRAPGGWLVVFNLLNLSVPLMATRFLVVRPGN